MSIQDDLKRARKRHATNQERAEDARARLKDVDEAIDDTREHLRTLRQRAKDLDHHGPHWEDLRSQVEELEEDLTRFLGRYKEILEHEKDVEEARALGGEWEIRNQCRVGFELLKGNIDWGGEFKGFGAYNGGRGNPIAAYAESCLALKKQWQARIDNAVR